MTDVKVRAELIAPLGGGSLSGLKLGFIDSGAKAAQNDTWIVGNAKTVVWAVITVDANGIVDATTSYTVSGNTITLTGASTGAHSALILYI